MPNNLVVIINSLKVPKIKKILLYEMRFLVPNYSCLQNPWLGGYRPQIPVLSVLCPQLTLLNPPPKKFLGTPLTAELIYLKKKWKYDHATCTWRDMKVKSTDCGVCSWPWQRLALEKADRRLFVTCNPPPTLYRSTAFSSVTYSNCTESDGHHKTF